jgi:dephospho-CoA kinase
VFTPTPLRIQRVINRDQLTREEVKSRMDKQIDETIKMSLCDFVINNNEQQLVIPQVIKIHETLLSKVELP